MYEACKDIVEGSELLVWYGDSYLQFVGVPICLKEAQNAVNNSEAESESKLCNFISRTTHVHVHEASASCEQVDIEGSNLCVLMHRASVSLAMSV